MQKNTPTYYILDSNYDRPDPSRAADRKLNLPYHSGCTHFKAPPPRTITTSYFSTKEVLTFSHLDTLIIRRDLFDFLNIGKLTGLQIGSLHRENGKPYVDHFSLWSPCPVLIRGEQKSVKPPCSFCGIPMYFPYGNDWYVTRQSIANVDVAIADGPTLLIINNELGQGILEAKRSGKWSKLTLQPINVVEHAIDGLPDDCVRPQEYLHVRKHLLA